MKVKEVERTANVAWSPKHLNQVYLAAGTAAQQLDASFSTSAALEIYALNLNDPGNDLNLLATIPSEQRFNKLAWGSHGQTAGTLVGGCDSGVIQIYNVSKLLQKEEALISKQTKHTGPVRAIDFNAYQTNLLASGASESEIHIWDLNNLSSPMTPGAKVQPLEDISGIAWNKQVQHILATSSSSRCVVWDLRKSDPIIKLSDTACRLRWSNISWNPDVATQLCLASEEDQSPFIQLWDLRFATSPVKVLEGHQKGVLSISWCAQDTEMMLSCGKDSRVLCWNPNATYQGGELICEMASPNQWNFDVAWCPKNPALFSLCSFDGHVSVCSMVGGPQQPQTSTKIADSFPGMELYAQAPPTVTHAAPVDLRKPPKWLQRPAVARFGFGGKLVITESKVITMCQVTAEPGLVARANLLDGALRADNCLEFCQGKVAASSDEHERTLWQFLHASFSQSPRDEYLKLLGFHRDEITAKLSKMRLRRGSAERLGALGRSTDTESDFDGSDELGDRTTSNQVSPQRNAGKPNSMPGTRAPRCYKISTTDDVDGLICEALLIGDTETAVELCVEDARWADAIILAMTGGSDLLARTQHRYLQENSGCLSKLISAVVTEDWGPVVENCDVSSWKEALVAALTHSSDEFPILCEALGERMESKTAQLCFLCAGNLGKLVSSWLSVNSPASSEKLQDLIEIIMLLKRAVEVRGRAVEFSAGIADLLSRYAIILASEGNLEMALSYLGTSTEESAAFLRERLYHSLGLRQPAAPTQQATRAPSVAQQRNRSMSTGYGAPTQMQPPAPEPQFNLNPVPPRQASPATSGLPARSKHVLDPSVTPASNYYGGSSAPYGSQPGNPFNPTPAAVPTPYNTQPLSGPTNPAPTPAYNLQPLSGPMNSAMPSAVPNQYQPFQPAPPRSQPTPVSFAPQPAGWNDPPSLSNASRPQPKKEVVHRDPITQPIFGAAPEPIQNGLQHNMYDPRQQQNQYQPGAAQISSRPPQSQYPPPPSSTFGPPQQGSAPPPQAAFPPPPQASFPPPPASSYPTQQTQSVTQPPFQNPFPPPPASSYPPQQTQSVTQPPFQNPFPPPDASPAAQNPFPPPPQAVNKYPAQPAPASQTSFPNAPPQGQSTQNPFQPPPSAFAPQPVSSRPPSQPSLGMTGGLPPNQTNDVTRAPVSMFPTPPLPNASAPQFAAPQQGYPQQQSFPPSGMPPAVIPQPAEPAPPVQAPRKTIPEEHVHLQTVLDELRNRCLAAANNPMSKRKLEDVSRKLDSLYDSLAENRLSSGTLQGLHSIAQHVQNGDYTGGLLLHTQLVSGSDFSQISSFMPGVKVLLQTALQLQVYL